MPAPHSERLDDAAFDDVDAPPGYRSHAAQSRFQTAFAILTVVYVLQQLIVPQVIQYLWMPEMLAFSGQMRIPTYDQAFAWKGSTWYPVIDPMAIARGKYELEPMNAAGQVDRSARLEVIGGIGNGQHYVPDGDNLWIVGPHQVVRVVPGHPPIVTSIVAATSPLATVLSPPILKDGVITLVGADATGREGLFELRNGLWKLVGQIEAVVPPDATQVNPQTGQTWTEIRKDYRLLIHGNRLMALRIKAGGSFSSPDPAALPEVWFTEELRTLPPDEAADGPADAQRWVGLDPSQWTTTSIGRPNAWCTGILADQVYIAVLESHVFDTKPETRLVLWTQKNQKWEQVSSTRVAPASKLTWLDATGDQGPAVLTTRLSAGFERISIVDGALGPSVKGGGIFDMMFAKMSDLMIWMTVYSLVTLVIAALLADWLLKTCRVSTYSFGKQTLALASFTRRGLARTIDMLIISAPSSAAFWWLWSIFDVDEFVLRFQQDPTQILTDGLLLFAGFFATMLIGWIFLSITEGCFGGSPGKWICGIRVWRRTLRPCGVFRAAVRIVLLIVDSFFGYAVGMAVAGYTGNRQRVGDLLMDTVVVRAVPRHTTVEE